MYLRKITRQQGQREIPARQTSFSGGENSDAPASEIGTFYRRKLIPNQGALIDNIVNFWSYAEGRKGSVNYTANGTLPGSGTVWSYTQNAMTGCWLLHRGAKLWLSTDVTQTEWGEVLVAANIEPRAAFATQFTINYRGASFDNVDVTNSKLYYSLDAVGILKRLRLYKDAAMSGDIMAEGTTLDEALLVKNPVVNNAGTTFTVDAVQGATPDNTNGGTLYWALFFDGPEYQFQFFSDVEHTTKVAEATGKVQHKEPIVSDSAKKYFSNMLLTGWDYSQIFCRVDGDGSGTYHALALYNSLANAVIGGGTGKLAYVEWLDTDVPLNVTIDAFGGSGISGTVDVASLNGADDPLYFNLTPSDPVIGPQTATPINPGGPAVFMNVGDLSDVTTINDSSDTVADVVAVHNDYIILTEQNDSGLGAQASLTYTEPATGDLNTVLDSHNINLRSRSRGWNDCFVLMTDTFNIFVNPTILKWYPIYVDGSTLFPQAPFSGTGSNTTSTPYGRRYIATFSRIETAGVPAYNANRLSAQLVFESAATKGGSDGVDYCEIWTPDAPGTIPTAAPRILYFRDDANVQWLYANGYYTHVSIYATQDVGPNGLIDNNQIFGWLEDVPISQGYYIDTIADTTLAFRLGFAAYLLQSRGYESMLSAAAFEFTPEMLYLAVPSMPTNVRYEFMSEPRFYGFHHPSQLHVAPAQILDIVRCGTDYFACLGKTITYISSPRSNQLEGSNYIVTLFQKQDDNIGIREYGVSCRVDDGNFIAICSDSTVRIFNGDKWGVDLSYNAVGNIVKQMLPYPLLAYIAGAFLIFYRTDALATANNKCMRYGFGGQTGSAWSRVSAPLPSDISEGDPRLLNIGLYAGVSRGVDESGIVRMFALYPVDGGEGEISERVYLMEQFPETGVWREGMDRTVAAVTLSGAAATYLSTIVLTGWDRIAPLYVRIFRGDAPAFVIYASSADRDADTNSVARNGAELEYDTAAAATPIAEQHSSGISGSIDFASTPVGDGSDLDATIVYNVAAFDGGVGIPCRYKTREVTGSSEREIVEHQASWTYLRPADADYINGIKFTSNVYVDGSPTPAGTMTDVPKDGQVGYYARVKGKRIQSEIVTTESGFRIIGIDGMMLSYDVAPVGQKMGLEQGYQKELMSGLVRWAMGRYRMKDRVSQGTYATAGAATPVAGPTGRMDAYSLAAVATLSDATTYTTAFTAMFWAKGSGAGFTIDGANPLVVHFPTVASMTVAGSTFAIGSIAANWSFFVIKRSGGFVSVYQGGVLVATIASSAALGGTSVILAAAIAPYDLRIKAADITQGALDYYLADVRAGGVKCLPSSA